MMLASESLRTQRFVNAGATMRGRTLRGAEELAVLLSRSRRLIWLAASRCLASAGESILAWQVISELKRGGPRHQAALAEAIAQHPAGLSRLLEELQSNGLTSRQQDPEDRRRFLVTITAKGKAWHTRHRPSVIRAVDKSLKTLTPAQQALMRRLLRRLVDNQANERSHNSSGG